MGKSEGENSKPQAARRSVASQLTRTMGVQQSRLRGSTIVELLVVVAVVAVLVGLLLAALRSIKSSGRQTVELNAAKHLMSAYTNYAAAHNDFVIPGYADWVPYKDAHPASRQLLAYDKAGKEIAGGLLNTARQRYLWRLAPYLSYNLRGLYTNENEE